jgi:hypothetical protein
MIEATAAGKLALLVIWIFWNFESPKRARRETVFRPKPLLDKLRNLARKLRGAPPEVPSESCNLSRRNRHRTIHALRAQLTAKNLIHLRKTDSYTTYS